MLTSKMADIMYLSEKGVKWHLTKIYKKLNCKNKHELMSWGFKNLNKETAKAEDVPVSAPVPFDLPFGVESGDLPRGAL